MINGGLRTKGIVKKSRTESPLISVITVVFNGEKTLEQTILSVINQTYSNIEYIIVDGASTDGTLNILKKYDNNIDYWQSEPDKGIYDAMNKGINLATGEYTYIIGCDDWLINRNIFTEIQNYFINNYDVISGRVWLVYKNGYQRLYDNRYGFSREQDIKCGKVMSPHQGMFVKTSVMRNYPFDLNYKIAADYKSLLTLWLDSKLNIVKIPNIIAFYNNEGASKKLANKRKDENIKILNEIGIWNNTWFTKQETKRKVYWYIKTFLISIGINKIKILLNAFISLYKHELVRHKCDWEYCHICKK